MCCPFGLFGLSRLRFRGSVIVGIINRIAVSAVGKRSVAVRENKMGIAVNICGISRFIVDLCQYCDSSSLGNVYLCSLRLSVFAEKLDGYGTLFCVKFGNIASVGIFAGGNGEYRSPDRHCSFWRVYLIGGIRRKRIFYFIQYSTLLKIYCGFAVRRCALSNKLQNCSAVKKNILVAVQRYAQGTVFLYRKNVAAFEIHSRVSVDIARVFSCNYCASVKLENLYHTVGFLGIQNDNSPDDSRGSHRTSGNNYLYFQRKR